MDKNEDFKIIIDPSLLEEVSKLPEIQRLSFLDTVERFRKNPYIGTPVSKNPIIHILNLMRRWHRNWQLNRH